MRILKGFIVNQSLMSNVPGVISEFGEISTWSMTYTKERGEYHDPSIPGYRLVSARSYDTELGEIEAPQSLINETIEMAVKTMQYVTQNLRPYDLEDFRNTLLALFHTRAYNINIGPFRNADTLALPEWISWVSSNHTDTFVRIWFSDPAFADQFDEYETTVIPPITNLDDFFLLPGEVKTKLESVSFTQLMERVQDAKDYHPESYIRSLSFDYIPPNDSDPIPTRWTLLLYGVAGDNIDSIKDAFIDYILANSSHSRTEWERILPSLFRRTEFIILPRWDKYSIPNLIVEEGLYSSLTNPLDTIAFCKHNIPFYTAIHVERSITILPHDYKAITIYVVNGFSNVPGKDRFDIMFRDYIPVASTSLDFNRMSVKTREWLLLFQEMLMLAETMNEFTSLPRKFRRIFRDNQLYISTVVDNVHYLVMSKKQLYINMSGVES
jgi:hypothetical protein